MTPTNKGNYIFCVDCRHLLEEKNQKYPYKRVRGEIKYERDYKRCLEYEKK